MEVDKSKANNSNDDASSDNDYHNNKVPKLKRLLPPVKDERRYPGDGKSFHNLFIYCISDRPYYLV